MALSLKVSLSVVPVYQHALNNLSPKTKVILVFCSYQQYKAWLSSAEDNCVGFPEWSLMDLYHFLSNALVRAKIQGGAKETTSSSRMTEQTRNKETANIYWASSTVGYSLLQWAFSQYSSTL